MVNYDDLFAALERTPGRRWLKNLPDQISTALKPNRRGQIASWQASLQSLPTNITVSSCNLRSSAVQIGARSDCDDSTRNQVIDTFRQMIPWRKGPYEIFGEVIDTEWRSDLKWDRLINHIQPLNGRLVLDVGCGNGYHCWRMVGEGAGRVIGVDPTLLFVHQFLAIKHFQPTRPIDVLPLTLEQIPANLQTFDSVFSMGVLYHRRSPIEHLMQLRDCLKTGGELILETLVVDGPEGYSLVPETLYAGMKNVWFIPTVDTLILWMRRCGFCNIRCIDVTATTREEQRTTEWINADSLINSVNPENPAVTQEGYPAPLRATIIANRQKNAS